MSLLTTYDAICVIIWEYFLFVMSVKETNGSFSIEFWLDNNTISFVSGEQFSITHIRWSVKAKGQFLYDCGK